MRLQYACLITIALNQDTKIKSATLLYVTTFHDNDHDFPFRLNSVSMLVTRNKIRKTFIIETSYATWSKL